MAVIIVRKRFFGIVKVEKGIEQYETFFVLWIPIVRKIILPWGVQIFVLGIRIDDDKYEKYAAEQYHLEQKSIQDIEEKNRKEKEQARIEAEKEKERARIEAEAEREKERIEIEQAQREKDITRTAIERVEKRNRFIETIRNREVNQYSPKAKLTNIVEIGEKEKVNSVLIINPFSIGDYVLFRNFIKLLKQEDRFKQSKITAIFSQSVKEIASYLDGDIIDKFFFLPHPFWKMSISDQLYEADKLFEGGLEHYYDVVIYASYNKVLLDDFNSYMQYNIFSKESIISSGDISVNSSTQFQDYRFYTRVVNNFKGVNTFEFDNNKQLFEAILGHKIDLKMQFIEKEKLYPSEYNGKKFAVINPSAQDGFRIWHPINYASSYLL